MKGRGSNFKLMRAGFPLTREVREHGADKMTSEQRQEGRSTPCRHQGKSFQVKLERPLEENMCCVWKTGRRPVK